MVLTRGQIEEGLKNKGDFVKLDVLNRYLQQADSLDIKKFILLKLVDIYQDRNFLLDAAKHLDAAADLVITYREKIDLYMKETELYVKLGQFDLADRIYQKAYAYGNMREKAETQAKYIDYYIFQAKSNEKEQKHRKAVEIYEKLYSMPQADEKRMEFKNKLLELYGKLGRIRDQTRLASKVEPKPEEKPKIMPGSFEDLGIRKY
ncbi:MAG: hypothetical protein WC781_00275 [Candidatus Pacearchaeota archaeon]|jgi:tetratricopeptide (TPR) repeat protein